MQVNSGKKVEKPVADYQLTVTTKPNSIQHPTGKQSNLINYYNRSTSVNNLKYSSAISYNNINNRQAASNACSSVQLNLNENLLSTIASSSSSESAAQLSCSNTTISSISPAAQPKLFDQNNNDYDTTQKQIVKVRVFN